MWFSHFSWFFFTSSNVVNGFPLTHRFRDTDDRMSSKRFSGNDQELLTPLEYSDEDLPTEILYPFQYEPHHVAGMAARDLQARLQTPLPSVGKMLGVLVVEVTSTTSSNQKNLGYLKAFSGQTVPQTLQEGGWCPPVFDYQAAGSFYKEGEAKLERITQDIHQMEQDPKRQNTRQRLQRQVEAAEFDLSEAKREQKQAKKQRDQKRKDVSIEQEQMRQQESAFFQRKVKSRKATLQLLQETLLEMDNEMERLRKNRTRLSTELTTRIFEEYRFSNAKGKMATLLQLFADTPLKYPPGGAGDCAAPKLFQAAYRCGYRPVALAEFWWGPPPTACDSAPIRRHGNFYPCCRGKCQPILTHMLQGLSVQQNPLEEATARMNGSDDDDDDALAKLEIVYEDQYVVVINKPAEVLSVPGRTVQQSVLTEMKRRYPDATGPLLCHRLDLSTSGLLVVAKTKEAHKDISNQFIERTIKKRYECLLEGTLSDDIPQNGRIDLPLSPDYIHRPMQMVDFQNGKPATTYYEILGVEEASTPSTAETPKRTRAYLYPVTGRTHQLRVHTAHPKGLNLPMVGDDIYGRRDERLCLHAGYLEMRHPVSGDAITLRIDAPF
jgi:tRNA pseudouridine32 synthase/23S rRNA pseudouridine746 synthase